MGSSHDVLTRDEASENEQIEQVNACFPGNATVVLRGGERVRMDELKIGDYVLSIHPTTHKPVYSKVISLGMIETLTSQLHSYTSHTLTDTLHI